MSETQQVKSPTSHCFKCPGMCCDTVVTTNTPNLTFSHRYMFLTCDKSKSNLISQNCILNVLCISVIILNLCEYFLSYIWVLQIFTSTFSKVRRLLYLKWYFDCILSNVKQSGRNKPHNYYCFLFAVWWEMSTQFPKFSSI